MFDSLAVFQLGALPVLAVAVHSGHFISPDLGKWMILDETTRLREEDPLTSAWAAVVPNHVVGWYSRFEIDLNRPRNKAVYDTPEEAWGLQVWKKPLPIHLRQRSLERYDQFYARLRVTLDQMVSRYGRSSRIAVLDLHTYNHRRAGPQRPAADPRQNPEINIGTGTLDRHRWSSLVDRFGNDLVRFNFGGRQLDVRENVRFQGGHVARWVHENYPHTVCALAIEVKKFFMDEWSGKLDVAQFTLIGEAIRSTLPGLLGQLKVRRHDHAA